MRDALGKFVKGHEQLNTGRTWIKKGMKVRLGISHTEAAKKKMSLAHKGKMPSNLEFLKTYKRPRGKEHHLWKGRTSELKLLRESNEFAVWRKSVFERDNYTCQICGKRGVELHPDHIKSFAHHPDLRFELSNGRTLCAPCHRKTPNYGRKPHLCCN